MNNSGTNASLNPKFMYRLNLVKTSERCRFCLGEDEPLLEISTSKRLQTLLSESYYCTLGVLKGNTSGYVCTSCNKKLEQSYDFLQMASLTQTLVKNYTANNGEWPTQSMLKYGEVKALRPRAVKRVASPHEENDEDEEQMEAQIKRVRTAEDFLDEQELGEPSGLTLRPENLGNANKEDLNITASTLDKTLSGEISDPELSSERQSASSSGGEFLNNREQDVLPMPDFFIHALALRRSPIGSSGSHSSEESSGNSQ